jgi:hypothetical protein
MDKSSKSRPLQRGIWRLSDATLLGRSEKSRFPYASDANGSQYLSDLSKCMMASLEQEWLRLHGIKIEYRRRDSESSPTKLTTSKLQLASHRKLPLIAQNIQWLQTDE